MQLYVMRENKFLQKQMYVSTEQIVWNDFSLNDQANKLSN